MQVAAEPEQRDEGQHAEHQGRERTVPQLPVGLPRRPWPLCSGRWPPGRAADATRLTEPGPGRLAEPTPGRLTEAALRLDAARLAWAPWLAASARLPGASRRPDVAGRPDMAWAGRLRQGTRRGRR